MRSNLRKLKKRILKRKRSKKTSKKNRLTKFKLINKMYRQGKLLQAL